MYLDNFTTKRSALFAVFRRIGWLFAPSSTFPKGATADEWRGPIEGRDAVPGVRIWYVDHASNSNLSNADANLTKSDFTEFAPVRHTATRQRSLSVRAVLRQALSESVAGKVAPNAWCFGRTANAQPILLNSENNLKFSCSHTSKMSVIAVSTVGDVGVDIADASFDFASDWLNDVMSERERNALEKLSVSKRAGAVSRLWTLKEAYVKMLGTGIAEIADVAFDLGDDRLLPGRSKHRFLQPVFRTWVVNNQGHRYSVALASSRSVSTRAPLGCCLSEVSLGHSRDRFPALAG